MGDESARIKPCAEKKAWLVGVRFSCLLACLLMNIVLLSVVFFMKQDGCVICLSTLSETTPSMIVKKNIFSDSGREFFSCMTTLSDQELIARLTSNEKIGLGYTEGDLAVGLLYARGFDVEPVLKTFSVWPMRMYLVPCTDSNGTVQEIPFFSDLKAPMRASLKEYFSLKKSPYRLDFVVKTYADNGDIHLAEESLQHRSDVRLWLGLYRAWHFSKEEAWKTVLAMKQEAIEHPPSDQLTLEELCLLFDKKIPSFLASVLIDRRLDACVAFEDEQLEKLLLSLDDYPKAKARLCLHLLRAPRKGAIQQRAKKMLADLTHEPTVEAMTLHELTAWLHSAKKDTKPPENAIIAQSKAQPRAEIQKIAVEQKVLVHQKQEVVQEQRGSVSHVQPSASRESSLKQTRFRLHVVQKGETLWKIAQKYKIDPNKLSSFNSLRKGKVEVGQKLRIPL